jgi:hypothetical protein
MVSNSISEIVKKNITNLTLPITNKLPAMELIFSRSILVYSNRMDTELVSHKYYYCMSTPISIKNPNRSNPSADFDSI